MAQALVTELIRVTGVSPYSVYSGQQRYSFNKGITSNMFVKGNTYSVSIAVSAKGAKYIHQVSNDLGALQADVNDSPAPALNPSLNKNVDVNRPRRAKMGEPLTDYDLLIQQSISRSGVVQAAVQAVASHAKDVDDLQVKAITLAEAMLSWVNKTNQLTTEPVSK